MKRLIKIMAAATVLIMISTSCQKDHVAKILPHGKWEITKFQQNDMDKTAQFADYVITFDRRGTVKAVRANSTVVGTWSTGNDYTDDDLFLDFGSNALFSVLNKGWHIREESTRIIRLKDIGNGGNGMDLLTFEKL